MSKNPKTPHSILIQTSSFCFCNPELALLFSSNQPTPTATNNLSMLIPATEPPPILTSVPPLNRSHIPHSHGINCNRVCSRSGLEEPMDKRILIVWLRMGRLCTATYFTSSRCASPSPRSVVRNPYSSCSRLTSSSLLPSIHWDLDSTPHSLCSYSPLPLPNRIQTRSTVLRLPDG